MTNLSFKIKIFLVTVWIAKMMKFVKLRNLKFIKMIIKVFKLIFKKLKFLQESPKANKIKILREFI